MKHEKQYLKRCQDQAILSTPLLLEIRFLLVFLIWLVQSITSDYLF